MEGPISVDIMTQWRASEQLERVCVRVCVRVVSKLLFDSELSVMISHKSISFCSAGDSSFRCFRCFARGAAFFAKKRQKIPRILKALSAEKLNNSEPTAGNSALDHVSDAYSSEFMYSVLAV